MPTKTSAVATFVRHLIAICGRSQREIADELGYPNPNIITMFKMGHTKVPLAIAGRLATALGCEPAAFVRLVLAEYEPELLTAIEGIVLSQPILSDDDLRLIAIVRETVQALPLDLSEPWARRALQDAVQTIADRQSRQHDAAIASFEALPRNIRAKF